MIHITFNGKINTDDFDKTGTIKIFWKKFPLKLHWKKDIWSIHTMPTGSCLNSGVINNSEKYKILIKAQI